MRLLQGFAGMLKCEFAGYNAKRFSKDILAGVTVAAGAFPLALAFGVSSGASAAAGLVTAIIAGLVIGLLSGSSYQIPGPTVAMAALLLPISAQYGLKGVFLACLLSGILLVLAGICKLGDIVSFIPLPVITGFTFGIGVVIMLGQINHLTGLTSAGEEAAERIASYFTLPQSFNPTALIVGLAVILLMAFYPKKWAKVCPASLMSIILATACNILLQLPVASVGEIPRTLLLGERLTFSTLEFRALRGLIMPAVSIAALGMIEGLLCGASAGRMKSEKFDPSQELIAQGIGNMVLPFFGGVPAASAISRTSVGVKAGGQTRLTSIIHSVILLVSMFAMSGIISKIPLCALAGVQIMTAWRMNEWHAIKEIFGKRIMSAILQFSITMVCTVVFDLTVAIVIGVLFSVMTFVVKVSNMQVTVSDVIPAKLKGGAAFTEKLLHTSVVYMTGPLYFGSVRRMEDALTALAGKEQVVFSLRGVSMADLSGVQALQDICARLMGNGTAVYFASVQPPVQEMFERLDLIERVGQDHFYWSTDQALEQLAA